MKPPSLPESPSQIDRQDRERALHAAAGVAAYPPWYKGLMALAPIAILITGFVINDHSDWMGWDAVGVFFLWSLGALASVPLMSAFWRWLHSS